MTVKRPKTRRARLTTENRIAKLERVVEIHGRTIGTLADHVAELNRVVLDLNGALKAVDKGARDVTRLLTTQLVALRDLLLAKGVLTTGEASTAAQVADLESMLEWPMETTKDDPDPQSGDIQ